MEIDLPVHPVCALFPEMPEREFGELRASIEANGQRVPILKDKEGRLLDGRHRYLACCELGVEPLIEEYTGEDPIGMIVALNLHRRHLTTGQVAAIGVGLADVLAQPSVGRPPGTKKGAGAGRATERAAKELGVSPRTISRAQSLRKKSPEAFEQVKAGTLALRPALEQADAGDATEAEPSIQAEAPHESGVDELGEKVPEQLREVFAVRHKLRELVGACQKVVRDFKAISQEPGASALNTQLAIRGIQDAARDVKNAAPYCVIPAKHKKSITNSVAAGRGWLTTQEYAVLPESIRWR